LIFGHGLAMALLLPLVAAFLLMITAMTYQFQGWLASLMSNPRRRRTIVVFITIFMILLFQAPNLINITMQPWGKIGEHTTRYQNRTKELLEMMKTGKITPTEFQRLSKEAQDKNNSEEQEAGKRLVQKTDQIIETASFVFPPCWLALSARSLATANVIPALLVTLGFALAG
jgi:hypothetical protein